MEDELSFEKALLELEEVVNNLEEGKLSLDESLKRFEEGIRLSRICNKKLEQARQKVNKLVEKDGKILTGPLLDE
jgi:exodeoxyribonuclease VII small subunit